MPEEKFRRKEKNTYFFKINYMKEELKVIVLCNIEKSKALKLVEYFPLNKE